MDFRISSRGYNHGQYDLTLFAEIDNKDVGYIDYSKYQDDINIQMIHVDDEFKRQGIATAMLKRLQKEYPDTEISWGMLTADGNDLYQKIDFDIIPNKEYQKKLAGLAKLKDLEKRFEEIAASKLDSEKKRDLLSNWNKVNDAIYKIENRLRELKPENKLIKHEN
jgi:GNAT superfamily N-acetyltransferase